MKNYIYKLTNFFMHNHFYILILFSILTGASLLIAYSAQYIFKMVPCKLCMYSRIPFLIITILPLFFLISKIKAHSIYALFIIGFLLFANIGLSFYHLGVENYWFKPSICKVHKEKAAEYKNELYDFFLGDETELSSCENVQFKLFGIFSFAALNLIFSTALFILLNFFIFQHFFLSFIKR